MEDAIIKALKDRGPLTGSELRQEVRGDDFALWRACMRSERTEVRRVGRRYLRLDRRVEGFARLSPSILREFLTYCVIGLRAEEAVLERRTETLAAHIEDVSAAKRRLGRRIADSIGKRVDSAQGGETSAYCILLAGDIVYGMAHDAPRSESSTGQMVRGSDIDLVVITEDEAPPELSTMLDETIYQEKYRLLNNPAFKEEIDYVVKPLSRMREQAAFDTFKHMVSCKILAEGELVFGSEGLHDRAKALLAEHGLDERLAAMEAEASVARDLAEGHLLQRDDGQLAAEEQYLFYTTEESEEFE